MKNQLLVAAICMIASTHTMKAPGPYTIVNNTGREIQVASSALPFLPGKNSYYTVKSGETYLLKALVANKIKIKTFTMVGHVAQHMTWSFNPKYNARWLKIGIGQAAQGGEVITVDQKGTEWKPGGKKEVELT